MNCILTLITLFCLFSIKHYCNFGTWKEKFQDLKNKASKLKSNIKGVVEKSDDDDQLGFTSNSELDYPHGNEDKLKKIHNLWDEYYNCQRIRVDTMGTKKRTIPSAVVALLGGYMKLNCEICTSPRDIDIEIEWYFSDTLDISGAQILMIDEYTVVSPHDDSLQIFNIHLSQAGLYVCKQGNNTASPYIVHVFNNETFTEVHPDTAPSPHTLPASTISKLHITLSAQWTEWSECSECGLVGRRVRLGICYVDLIDDQKKPRTATYKRQIQGNQNLITSKTLNKKVTRNTASFSNMQNKLEILEIFEDGIPCRSKLLPEFIVNAWEVKSRPSEIMVGFCKVPCPENTIFIISDEKGNIIDAVNNSAGEYSYYQGKPTVPNVERVAMFAEYKSSIIIICPGSNKKNTPTKWFTGKTALVNKLLKKQTHNRVFINKNNNLVIKDVMFSDARVYSCWQRKALVGTVRLYVNKVSKIKINRPITFIGASVILITFGIVYLKVFTNKMKK